jgi:DNA-binding HxlR family transcriptional regulator
VKLFLALGVTTLQVASINNQTMSGGHLQVKSKRRPTPSRRPENLPAKARGEEWPDFRSPCSVASALDLLGDRWTLVVLRTIFAGRHRYSDLAEMPETISTNILADRLDRLERYGLISKTPYQQHPARYEYRLTVRGADLLPVLQALAVWSKRHIPDRWDLPRWFAEGKPEDFYPAGTGKR